MDAQRELFEPISGFSRGIGFYLASLEYSRRQWREKVVGLTKDELSKNVMAGAQAIGTLILHIAEAEYWWIQCIVAGKSREVAVTEVPNWDIPSNFDFAATGYDIAYCIAEVERIHGMSRVTLANFTDSDLEQYFTRRSSDNKQKEMTLRWILQHLIDHEATHKGQILMLKRLIQNN